MRSGAAIAALVTALLLSTASASAAVVSGSVIDPQGDGSTPFGDVHPNDIAYFGLQYDGDTGQVTTSLRVYDERSPRRDYSFGAQVGVWNRKLKACDVQSSGAATVTVLPAGDAPINWDTALYSVVGYNGGAEQTFYVYDPPDKWWEPDRYAPDRTRFDRITDTAAFAGRGYNCVTNIVLHDYSVYGGDDWWDTAATFCMGPSGTIQCSRIGKGKGRS